MTIEVGGGGAKPILQYSQRLDTNYNIKDALAATHTPQSPNFWTAVSTSWTAEDFETPVLSAATDTTEQTIVDISGAGVFTHCLSPILSGTGTITIKVTIDGGVKTYVSNSMATGRRFLLGYYAPWDTSTSSTGAGTGYGSYYDTGFDTTTACTIPTPAQTVSQGLYGLKFSTSLKVTVQGSVNIAAGTENQKCYAGYTLFIPEGY